MSFIFKYFYSYQWILFSKIIIYLLLIITMVSHDTIFVKKSIECQTCFVIKNVRDTCSFVEMLKGYMIRERLRTPRVIFEAWLVWRENGFKYLVIRNVGKSLHEFYCTVLGIVATVVSLIDSLGEAVRNLSNRRSSIAF